MPLRVAHAAIIFTPPSSTSGFAVSERLRGVKLGLLFFA